MRRRISVFVVLVAAAATMTALLAPQGGAAAPASTAFTALSGRAASSFTVPADLRLVRRLELGRGTYERYQQVYGTAGAYVLGGQISVYRNASGAVRTVIGSRHPAITPQNSVRLSKAGASRRPAATSARPGHEPSDS